MAAPRTSVPAVVTAPSELVAGMAVPAVLIAYGASLRLGPLPVANSVFVLATRFGRARLLAHDATFVTTVATIPALLTAHR